MKMHIYSIGQAPNFCVVISNMKRRSVSLRYASFYTFRPFCTARRNA